MGDLADQLAQHAMRPEQSIIDAIDEGRSADGQAPTVAEMQQECVAPGERALLPIGVVYQADWKIFADGIAKHAREQVAALASAGVPVFLTTVSSANSPQLDEEIHPDVASEVGFLSRVTFSEAAVAVRQAIFHSPDFVRGIVLPRATRLLPIEEQLRVLKSTVVYTSWERDCVSKDIVDVLKRCAQVWVPCEANRRAFVSSGVPAENVRIVPCPYDPSNAVSRIPEPRGSGIVPAGRRFYSIGKWEPRKNQAGLLRAFFAAFTPKERASLLIKTHGFGEWDDYPGVEDAMGLALEDSAAKENGWTVRAANRLVKIVCDKISDDEIVALHRNNNIYVSASHGEAWDVPAFEARCAGNRLVYVPYGGPQEYAADDDVPVEDITMECVHPEYGWEPHARWADYAQSSLVAALRAARPPAERIHPPRFNGAFSRHAVGELMKRHLIEVCEALRGAGSFG